MPRLGRLSLQPRQPLPRQASALTSADRLSPFGVEAHAIVREGARSEAGPAQEGSSMTEQRSIPMSRARLYVLIDSFERDIRQILARYVVSEIGESGTLGEKVAKCDQRRAEDAAASESSSLVDYLDLREAYDLLNAHRGLLPEELGKEARELTPNLDRVVAIRKRVMHARPLAEGDSDAAISLLTSFRTRWWAETQRTIGQLDTDPSWEPLVEIRERNAHTLHNLPLPEYDETGLVGRSKEVGELVALLKRRREPVITVTGEGGIGKTALAIQVAFDLVDDIDRPFDAVLWTSLKSERLTANGVREIADAARDLAGAMRPLGATFDSNFVGTVEELAQVLNGLKVLVVFDNLESLGGAEFSTLYNALPDDVAYLVTSRLGIGEFERRYPLNALSERDSIHLLNDLARSRRIEHLQRVSMDTRRIVVEKLRYSPLAIRWFVLATEAGRDPLQLIKDQGELLEFCVRSVFDALSGEAQAVLAALSVVQRPLTADELVVLLDTRIDNVNLGMQELMRGSLIRRDATLSAGDLAQHIRLTETASEFLAKKIKHDPALVRRISKRDQDFRQIEERRAAEAEARSLAPVVIHARGPQDTATAQLLRQAMLYSAEGNHDSAFELVERARNLNPDFFEVDRVDAFIRSSRGELAPATSLYTTAHGKAHNEEKAVVAHFFAGHLARRVRDVTSAIGYAREAHNILSGPETALGLGNYLVWSRQFGEGITLIESATQNSQGKVRLIALSSLAEAYRRWAEHAGEQEHNPVVQFDRARQGLKISLAAIEAGIADTRLRETACECALLGIYATLDGARASLPIAGLGEWFDSLAESVVRLYGTSHWAALSTASRRAGSASGALAGAKRLADRVNQLDPIGEGGPVRASNTLVGEITVLKPNFGFIRHPAHPKNLFFHQDDVAPEISFRELREGDLVQFVIRESDRGARATAVWRVR